MLALFYDSVTFKVCKCTLRSLGHAYVVVNDSFISSSSSSCGIHIQNREFLAFPMRLRFLKRVHILPEESFNKNFISFFSFFLFFFFNTGGVFQICFNFVEFTQWHCLFIPD